MTKKTIGQFIREKREELGLSVRQLAERAGVSDVHIGYIEKSKRDPSFKVLSQVISALRMPWDQFLIETGYIQPSAAPAKMGQLNQIPLISWVKAGDWQEVCDIFEPGDADEWIETEIKGKCVFALRVAGDSMEPEFNEGEILVIIPHVDIKPGDFVVVRIGKEEATLKQLKKYGNTFVLHPLNPRYQDMEVKKSEFQVIGKVVKKVKRY
ncbi:MAG: XRE family transcriptional regulator [Syntrophales bacterium]|nr:XRE family transcriptional regulator [Syntrophales bacterium]